MLYADFKRQCDEMAAKGLELLIQDAGTLSDVARLAGVDRSSAGDWNAVPLRHLGKFCNAYGKAPQRYRPDLFWMPKAVKELE